MEVRRFIYNRSYLEKYAEYLVPEYMELAIVTPETSGGLVFAFSKEKAEEFLSKMNEASEMAYVIGRVIERLDKKIIVI